MADWDRVRLGQVVECYDTLRRPVKASDRRPGPYPYYGASGVVDSVDSYLFDGVFTLVAEDGENLRTRRTPIAFLASGQFWVNNHAHILGGTSQTDVRYLAYRLQASDVSGYLTGSTQPKLTQQALLAMPFDWPPLSAQRAIGEVLGALDDKIDVNLRLRSACNELADAAFELALRRADEEGTAVLGRLGDIATVNAASTKPGAGVIRYLDISAVGDGRFDEPSSMSWTDAPSRARRVARHGDVLWSTVRPNRRSHCLLIGPPEDLVVSTGFAVLTPRTVGPSFLYAVTGRTQFVDYLVSVAEGSAYPAVRADRFEEAPIPMLSAGALAAYDEATMPLRERAAAADNESLVLSGLRDAVLPALLSGELRVRHAEAQVGAAV